jgi:hypothetical protein
MQMISMKQYFYKDPISALRKIRITQIHILLRLSLKTYLLLFKKKT